jgi:small nuclear ribonucleoprotein (snRNP)-like protein
MKNIKNMNNNVRNEQSYRNPLSIIYKQIGSEIKVFLKTGEVYMGTLAKVDNYMNLLLENTIEELGEKTTRYGKALIRGNNILMIKVEKI